MQMYCHKCGYKVKNGSANCANCGAEVLAEFCGGFWDILEAPATAGEQNSGAAFADAEMKAKQREAELKEKMARREQEMRKKFQIRIIALVALCGLLLIGCVIQTIRVGSANAKLVEVEEMQAQSSQEPEKQVDEREQDKTDVKADSVKVDTEMEKPEKEEPMPEEKETEEPEKKEPEKEAPEKDEAPVSESETGVEDSSVKESDSDLQNDNKGGMR